MSERNQPIISGIEGTVTIHSDVDATTSAILLNNWTAIIAPTVTDDSAAGYAIGSEWTDVTADKSYKLVDASVGAAVWKEITAAGGGGVVWRHTARAAAHRAREHSLCFGQHVGRVEGRRAALAATAARRAQGEHSGHGSGLPWRAAA